MVDKSPRESNLSRLFSGATTATFIIQLLTILVLIGALVGYALWLVGVWALIRDNQDIIIFLLLVGGAVAFAIFMLFFGFFIRTHGRVKHFVLGEGIGAITGGDGQIILMLFAFSVVFFTLAGIYAIYLLWKYLFPYLFSITNSIYPNIIILCIAILVVTGIIQLATRMVSRYAQNIVKRITDEK